MGKRVIREELLPHSVLYLLGQVIGIDGIGIGLFDQLQHLLRGQWHHLELIVFERH